MVQKRDTLLINAIVRTVDPRNTVAEAVLMRNGTFAAVGSESDVRRWATPDAEILDMGGGAVRTRSCDWSMRL